MSKIKIRFFTIADYEEEELWLREQHKNGLRFVKVIVPCFYVFEECIPEDVVYRLDYKNGKQNSDYMQMFADYGWEYFTCCTGWLYFRRPASEIHAENDGEIFSDPVTKTDMIEHVIKTRMIPLFLIFLCCVLPNWIKAIMGDLNSFGYLFSIMFTVLMAVYMFLIIYCGLKLRKLRKKYHYEL